MIAQRVLRFAESRRSRTTWRPAKANGAPSGAPFAGRQREPVSRLRLRCRARRSSPRSRHGISPDGRISITRVARPDTNSRSCDTNPACPGISPARTAAIRSIPCPVVGRLVQQHDVVPAQHQAAEGHAVLLAAGQHLAPWADRRPGNAGGPATERMDWSSPRLAVVAHPVQQVAVGLQELVGHVLGHVAQVGVSRPCACTPGSGSDDRG